MNKLKDNPKNMNNKCYEHKDNKSKKIALKFHDALIINLPENLVNEFMTTPIQDYDEALTEAITDYIEKFNRMAKNHFDKVLENASKNSGFCDFKETSEEMVREARKRISIPLEPKK